MKHIALKTALLCTLPVLLWVGRVWVFVAFSISFGIWDVAAQEGTPHFKKKAGHAKIHERLFELHEMAKKNLRWTPLSRQFFSF